MLARYEEFLRQRMVKSLDRARVEGDQQSRERICDFEEDCKRRIKKENEDLLKKKEKELEEIRKKTEETKKKIEATESKESEQREKKIRELEKSAEEQIEKIRKEYGEVIEKNLAELKGEQLEFQKSLIDANSDNFKLHREFEETKIVELEKSKENARLLAEEQAQEKKKRLDEIRMMTQQRAEQKVQNEIAVMEKREENAEKQLELSKELTQLDMNSQLAVFQTLGIRMDQLVARDLNDEVERLGRIGNSVNEHFGQCKRFFMDGLQAAHIKRAKECFEGLEFDVQQMSEHLVKMQRKLADLPGSQEKTQLVEEVKEVSAKMLPLGSCIAGFLGTFMIGSNTRDKNNEETLAKLILELDNLITSFGRFESKMQEMNTHIDQRVDHLRRNDDKKMLTGASIPAVTN